MSKTILGVKLYTYDEVAEMLDVSRTAVNKYVKECGLQARTIGAKRYIAEENLRSFILSSDEDTSIDNQDNGIVKDCKAAS